MNQHAIGKAIKVNRKNSKITQKQLAKMIEKSESTIQKYESGEVEAPLSVLEQIANCLNIEIFELIDDDLNVSFDDYIAKTDEILLEYCKILGYNFQSHPDFNDKELLIHYGYSYDIPVDDWIKFIDDARCDIKDRLELLIEKHIASKKIVKAHN